MLGLKRILFPANSPELALDVVTQRGHKRQRTTKDINNPCQSKRMELCCHGNAISGGILACIPNKQNSQADKGRRGIHKTSKTMGSVLMNLENLGGKNIDRERDLKVSKRGVSGKKVIPMDSLAGDSLAGGALPVVSASADVSRRAVGKRRPRKSPKRIKLSKRQVVKNNGASKRSRHGNRVVSNVDSLVSCFASIEQHLIIIPTNNSTLHAQILGNGTSKPASTNKEVTNKTKKKKTAKRATKRPKARQKIKRQMSNPPDAANDKLEDYHGHNVPISLVLSEDPEEFMLEPKKREKLHGLISPTSSYIPTPKVHDTAGNELSTVLHPDISHPISFISVPNNPIFPDGETQHDDNTTPITYEMIPSREDPCDDNELSCPIDSQTKQQIHDRQTCSRLSEEGDFMPFGGIESKHEECETRVQTVVHRTHKENEGKRCAKKTGPRRRSLRLSNQGSVEKEEQNLDTEKSEDSIVNESEVQGRPERKSSPTEKTENIASNPRRSAQQQFKTKEEEVVESNKPSCLHELQADDIFNTTPMQKVLDNQIGASQTSQRATSNHIEVINPVQTQCDEDDIFNATPMQEACGKIGNDPLNTADDGKTNNSMAVLSKRKRNPPKRFGVFENDDTEESPPIARSFLKKSALKKTDSRTGKQQKKRVRISSEGLCDHEVEDRERNESCVEWTATEMQNLLQGQKEVDPKSLTFWEDIASAVVTKSSEECMEKWFSLAKTPIVKKTTKKAAAFSGVPIDGSQCLVLDDDIFNATPMRGIFDSETAEIQEDTTHLAHYQLEMISQNAGSSAIKVSKSHVDEENEVDHYASSSGHPQGYKTYIQQVGRNVRQKDPKTKKGKQCPSKEINSNRHLQERSDDGEIQMNCRLSPGGTIQLKTSDDCYGDYLLDEYGEHVEDDEGDEF